MALGVGRSCPNPCMRMLQLPQRMKPGFHLTESTENNNTPPRHTPAQPARHHSEAPCRGGQRRGPGAECAGGWGQQRPLLPTREDPSLTPAAAVTPAPVSAASSSWGFSTALSSNQATPVPLGNSRHQQLAATCSPFPGTSSRRPRCWPGVCAEQKAEASAGSPCGLSPTACHSLLQQGPMVPSLS